MGSLSKLPGRKRSSFSPMVSQLTSGRPAASTFAGMTRKAAASRVMVCTMDARGTAFNLGTSVDAIRTTTGKLRSRRAGLASGEIIATREPLRLIAKETGERLFLTRIRSTTLFGKVSARLQNISRLIGDQYLNLELGVKSQARILISIRPDLTVRWRSNYTAPDATATADDPRTVPTNDDLRATVESADPKNMLPLSLLAGYDSSANGERIKISMQVERQFWI